MKCTIISQPSNYVPCREKLWKYQEHIDSSLIGQPFIGKVGKTRKGEMLMHIHASVSSVTPSPPPPTPINLIPTSCPLNLQPSLIQILQSRSTPNQISEFMPIMLNKFIWLPTTLANYFHTSVFTCSDLSSSMVFEKHVSGWCQYNCMHIYLRIHICISKE